MALHLDALDAGLLPDRRYTKIIDGEGMVEDRKPPRNPNPGMVTRGTPVDFTAPRYGERRMLDARPRAGRLVRVLIDQLRKLDVDAATAATVWYDRNEDTITVDQCSEWITRLRTKLATYNGQPLVTTTTPDAAPVTAPAAGGAAELIKLLAALHDAVPAHPDRGMVLRRYAIDGFDTGNETRFYKLRESKRGRRYLVAQLSDEERMVPWAEALIVARKIADDPMAAMLRYGREIGSCGHCGRTLTNDESRALGIGPVCRKGFAF